MNDLDATTAGYGELAGPGANDGKGWEPIGDLRRPFRGSLDGQGYEISGLHIDRPRDDHVGLLGIVGEEGRIRNVRLMGADINGRDVVGGLAGANHGGVFNSCSVASVGGVSYVGGLIGSNRGTVSGSYSGGNITGILQFAGGLVARNRGEVFDCYSTARVSADGAVGGLVGQNTDGALSNAYATGDVSGHSATGGLVGHHMGAVSGSFWDTQASRTEQSAGGTGKTTAEMMDITTFADTATEGLDEPWDIVAVDPRTRGEAYTWNIVDGETYPFLSWEPIY